MGIAKHILGAAHEDNRKDPSAILGLDFDRALWLPNPLHKPK
jgi:hypothetical protein